MHVVLRLGAALPLLLVALAEPRAARAQAEARPVVIELARGSEAWVERGQLIWPRSDLAPLRRVLAEFGVRRGAVAPTFARSREDLGAEHARAERRSGRRVPELALFFTLAVDDGVDAESLAAALADLPGVASARAWPRAVPPPYDIDPPTPDYSGLQSFKAAAPAGIGFDAFAGVAGADGQGTRFADLEYEWSLAHEDLEIPESARIPVGTAQNPWPDQGSHGSAVLGILSARANGYGVTGLVPAAQPHVAACSTVEYGWDVGRAIEQSIGAFGETAGPGDLILIEQQMYVCGADGSGGSQLGAGPVEWFPAWRAAIATATALGITVVEAAGNGSVDLDSPACGGAFDRAVADSGAILVAAGSAASHAPVSYATYGSRVDVQGIAEGIVTLGGGGLFGGSDPLQRYQSGFGGSSGASAMVAGVALAVQGQRRVGGHAPLEPLELRDLLVQTGTPQDSDPRLIGPLPDLAAASAVGVPAPQVTSLSPGWALALCALLFVAVATRARARRAPGR